MKRPCGIEGHAVALLRYPSQVYNLQGMTVHRLSNMRFTRQAKRDTQIECEAFEKELMLRDMVAWGVLLGLAMRFRWDTMLTEEVVAASKKEE